uniref:Uncharacterized protein n=1 Tax=Arundo donax TaxID=35708 RepID=A0A0A9FG54_ARUDO
MKLRPGIPNYFFSFCTLVSSIYGSCIAL